MSPEQARGGKVDAKSDVFSLGVLLYQMLTGQRPFQGASAVDIISSILRDKPPSVTDLRADLPPHLGRILRRCLEKDPRDRYQTSRDVYNELRELRAEASSSTSARPPLPEAGAPSRPPSTPARAEDGFWVAVLPFKYAGADAYGVLVHAIRSASRQKDDAHLTPGEWQFQYFAYREQITPAAHAQLKARLERAVEREGRQSDLWACLAQIYVDEYAFGFRGD